ncbi:phosphonate ABC transporter, permease protein PhnE [Phytoactinopolyspora endophytica]|uniref:phosphonate ABC transporter, permease protein PhnE n=1 Tax=Phytoactinopolyspora endophytica TaxID=1642495 RepID=UPI00101BF546|nr:phosphonate ABC transporter, permease protein PhnE [Phytoactinopolyspora endophytica]
MAVSSSRSAVRRSPAPTYAHYRQYKQQRVRRNLVVWAVVFGAVTWAVWSSGFGLLTLFNGLSESYSFIVTDALPPKLESVPDYLGPTLETLYMSVVGLVISVVISVPIGILGARNTTVHRVVSYLAKSIAGIARAAPSLVITVFFVAVFGVGPLAGTLALGLGGVGILGKVYADAIEEIDAAQIEGVRSTGASWLQILGQGVWPQFKPAFMTWTQYRFERNVRGGAVIGLVGGGGLGFSLISAINLYQFRDAMTIILMIFVMVMVIELATRALRRRAI